MFLTAGGMSSIATCIQVYKRIASSLKYNKPCTAGQFTGFSMDGYCTWTTRVQSHSCVYSYKLYTHRYYILCGISHVQTPMLLFQDTSFLSQSQLSTQGHLVRSISHEPKAQAHIPSPKNLNDYSARKCSRSIGDHCS